MQARHKIRNVHTHVFVIGLAALAAAPALAQDGVGRSRVERASARAELRQDSRQTVDDLRDLARLQLIAAELDEARLTGDVTTLYRIDAALERAVRAEIAEGQKEIKQDKAERRRSKRELRSSRREQRDTPSGTWAKRDDRRDQRDDRRDLRDDRRDLERERQMQAQRVEIAQSLQALNGRIDTEATRRKALLVDELIAIARAEVVENEVEQREDRRELREDRRELREDRRQRG